MLFYPMQIFSKGLEIPCLRTAVKAGSPSSTDNIWSQEIDLNEQIIQNREATFLARVVGSSMESTLFDGDILVVDRSLDSTHGDIVVAIVEGEFTVKRLIIHEDSMMLYADNPIYPPIVLQEGMNFWVWGVVTHAIRKT